MNGGVLQVIKFRRFALLLLVGAAFLIMVGCNNTPDTPQQPLIIEPGLNNGNTTPIQPELPSEPDPNQIYGDEPDPDYQPDPYAMFTDFGEDSTIDDLINNLQKIASYYYEQTLNYATGTFNSFVWYKDGQMRIINTGDGINETHFFYDFRTQTIITHTPIQGDIAMMFRFEEDDPTLPHALLQQNYHESHFVGMEIINGQTAFGLEIRGGDILWVSTKTGFPIQIEFYDDTISEHLITSLENIQFNQVTLADVEPPDHLIVHDLGLNDW